MSNKIGRFEIISELSRSEAIAVYKATDPEDGQTVAVKVLKLEGLGEQAKPLVEALSKEVESGKSLQSPNVTSLITTGEADNAYYAALEYVQGNSVATTLSRKEGFSIWDLLDIARQACQGLDHAHSHNAFHYTLEPAKIMVTWDGTVKLLSFGVSQMSAFTAQQSGQPSAVLHYMSPEQLRGEPIDARSNLFSLGAIFYEMMTECKAFQGEDADQVRRQILEFTPTPLHQINRKINPALSEVILKALEKDPAKRYQSGKELVNDLEKCKNSPVKAAASSPAAAKPAAVAQPGFDKKAIEQQIKEKLAASVSKPVTAAPESPKAPEPAPQKAAAAAGWGGANTSAAAPRTPKLDPSEQFITATAKASVDAMIQEGATLSAAPAETEAAPKLAVDPMMAEPKKGAASSTSFSEINELPPLKEVYVAPPVPLSEPAAIEQPEIILKSRPVEKPKIQPREAAKKAVTEIKKTPPQLFGYSIAGAIVVILLVIGGIAWRIHSENSWDENVPVRSAAPVEAPRPKPAASTPQPVQAQPQSEVQAVAPPPAPAPEADQADVARDTVSVSPRYKRKKARPVAPVILPGQLTLSTTPAGAEVVFDGQRDPSWVTPVSLTGITPGQHTISFSKHGYSTETRTIGVTQGSKSLVSVQLAQLSGGVSVSSTPSGAEIYIDGRDTGHVTPAQLSVDKAGNHILLVRKPGYLDESTSLNVQFGQTFHVSPTLKALGVTDEIRYKKMFGGKSDGMGLISVKTNPKGAQIAVNHRILDRNSPAEFYLNPGTYMIDVTSSGYKNIHRVIEVSRDGKVNIDERMDPE